MWGTVVVICSDAIIFKLSRVRWKQGDLGWCRSNRFGGIWDIYGTLQIAIHEGRSAEVVRRRFAEPGLAVTFEKSSVRKLSETPSYGVRRAWNSAALWCHGRFLHLFGGCFLWLYCFLRRFCTSILLTTTTFVSRRHRKICLANLCTEHNESLCYSAPNNQNSCHEDQTATDSSCKSWWSMVWSREKTLKGTWKFCT